jgi:ATP-dependent Lon protease
MNNIIPLFPLKIVVYPNSSVPLHIFEERYKTMINLCLENDSGFGIVSLIRNKISNVGCYVKITKILKKYPGGESDIIAAGIRRFVIKSKTKKKNGYFEAEILELKDEEDSVDEKLLYSAENKFNELVTKTQFKLEENFWNNLGKADIKSFKIAEKSGLNLNQQQKLLEILSENQRLIFLIDHFNKLKRSLNENLKLRSIILGDGYIN